MASTSRQNEVGMGLRIALDTFAIDFAATQGCARTIYAAASHHWEVENSTALLYS
jgi:hypothetical protein